MTIADTLRQIKENQDRQRFDREAVVRRAAQPSLAAPTGFQQTNVKNWKPGRYADLIARGNTQTQPKSGGLMAPVGWAAKGFGGLLDIVDTPRAAVVSGIQEASDAIGITEGNASWGDWLQQTRDNMGFGEWVENVDSDIPHWRKVMYGFAGDLAADPLLYLSAGTVPALKNSSKGATALESAFNKASRRGLAETVVEVGEDAITRGAVTREAVDSLSTEAGKRGRAAFTRKGLARAGVSADDVAELGLDVRKGIRTGWGRQGVYVPGSQKYAELVENSKGALKAFTGSTKTSKALRNKLVGDDSWVGAAERRFLQEMYEGSTNAADAARGLVLLRTSRADSERWFSEMLSKAKTTLPELQQMDEAGRINLTHAIESGDWSDPVAAKVKGWFDESFDSLTSQGIDMLKINDGYMPHVWNDNFRKLWNAGDSRIKAAFPGFDAEVPFLSTRELTPGKEFLGITLKGNENGIVPIQELNDISQQVLGQKIFTDDAIELMSYYASRGRMELTRQSVKNNAEALGAARQMATGPDVPKLQSMLEEAQLAEMEAQRAVNKQLKNDLSKATKEIGKVRQELVDRAAQVSRDIDTTIKFQQAKQARLSRLRNELRAATEARNLQAQLLENPKKLGSRKGQITRKIKKLDKRIAEFETQVNTLEGQLSGDIQGKKLTALQQELDAVNNELQQTTMEHQSMASLREAMDDQNLPVLQDPVSVESLAQADERVRRVNQAFLNATDDVSVSANALVYQMMDAESTLTNLNNNIIALDDAMEMMRKSSNVGRYGKTPEARAVRLAAAEELKGRADVIKAALAKANTPDADAAYRSLVQSEAQMVSYEMAAWNARNDIQKWTRALDSFDSKEFADYMQTVVDDGFTAIDDRLQMPTWMNDAMNQAGKLHDPEAFQNMKKVLRGYDKALNLWKGYAVTTPGFIFRNLYSGLFNMYLDDVSVSSVRKTVRFVDKYERKGSDAAWAWARKTMAPEEVSRLEDAVRAAAATGWGLNPEEITTKIGRGVTGGRTWNPLDPDFVPIKAVRNGSSEAEAIMRISHAYDVMSKGGTLSSAIGRVEKFHFNYRDISDFDRAAKRVVPFWSFYSRNFVLQAEMWARKPGKLNRSYFNLKRNMELNAEEDQVVPGYYDELGAIRTGIGKPNGGQWYFTPDLPSLRFRQDLASLADPGGEGFDPLRLLSDSSPAIKIPVEAIADKQLFTNIDFKNRLYDYDSEGNTIAREAPIWAQIPGVDRTIDALDPILPGETQMVNGKLLMSDKAQVSLENISPALARATRLLPNQPKYQERWGQSVLSTAGLPARKNTPQSIQGELYGRQKRAQEANRQSAIDQLLQELTGG